MTHIAARWGGTAAIVAGISWFVGLGYMTLDELEYQGWIAVSPMPDAAGMGAYVVAGVTTGLAVMALRALVTAPGARAGVAIAFVGAALALIPLWPATFLAPVLAGIGLFVLGIVARRSEGFKSRGSSVHVYGLPGALLAGTALDALEFGGPGFMLLYGAALAAGLIWIGIDMNGSRRAETKAIGAMA